jgi:NADPH2:quinone reductase
MRAWLLPALTGIDSMTLSEAPDPTVGDDDILLQTHFAALNPADNYLAMNQYPAKPTFPHILGRDGIGTVLAVGKNITTIKPGDTRLILRSEVGVSRWGTLAEKVTVEARYTVPLPEGWSEEQAAAAPLVYITAWQALTQFNNNQPLAPNTAVLITGASGGVGVAATQLAHAMQCTVVALSRSPKKSETLRTLGADLVLDPENKSWRKTLTEQLGKNPIHLAIDNIGGPLFPQLLETLAMFGKCSVVGRLAGPVPEFNTASLFFRRLQIGGIAIASYTHEETITVWKTVLATLNKTNARPLIDHIFKMEEVPAAFARLHEGPMGKVLVRIP